MAFPRVLFGVTEVPGVGGNSTALYDLFGRMRREGHDVHMANILEESDSAFYRHTFGAGMGNPRTLDRVTNVWIRGDPLAPQPDLAALIAGIDPTLLVGFGYYASMLMKGNAPDRRTVLVTGSCQQAAEYVTTGRARDAVALEVRLQGSTFPPRPIQHGERTAVSMCDLIVTHSPQTRRFMEAFFPTSIGKIYPREISFAEWIRDGAMAWRHLARPFNQRDIDVLFIATDWARAVKNWPVVRSLAGELRDHAVHIVGDVRRAAPGAVHHGFLESREALFDLMGRARCVACPSLIDAAPGILFEASVLGANVVCSRNCGNWEVCNPQLLVEVPGVEEYARRIRAATERKFDDDLASLLGRGGYAELQSLLIAFASPFPRSPVS